MADTGSVSPGRHVAFLGFPVFSHGMPLFNLTLKLARESPDVQFSYFNSSRNVSKILSSTTSTTPPTNLRTCVVEDGIPRGYDIDKLPHREFKFFADVMPGNFERGICAEVKETGREITCIVADAFFSFLIRNLLEVARVPWVAFCVSSPQFHSVELNVEQVKKLYTDSQDKEQAKEMTLDATPGLASMRMSDVPNFLSPYKEPLMKGTLSPVGDILTKMRFCLPKASAVVFTTYMELTPALLREDLSSKLRNTLYVGCMSNPSNSASSTDVSGCLLWLDEQNEASVVYVSFGTTAPYPREEIAEVAEAIEAFGLPFLWSLADDLRRYLPDGFLERTSKQGKVVRWTPQSRVLSHPSTGVHVTHCGNNAVAESIFGGVPLICRPTWADNQ